MKDELEDVAGHRLRALVSIEETQEKSSQMV
jgi:hypothetical protein